MLLGQPLVFLSLCYSAAFIQAFLVPSCLPSHHARNSQFPLWEGAQSPESTYFEFLQRSLELARRPKPINFPRPRIERDFAVLLMRSSYAVADELDFIPMDQFQKQFFLFRQGEWLDYKEAHTGIQQGDLTSPDYFDFISFAQYSAISTAMDKGEMVFVEKVNAAGDEQMVRRDPSLLNAQLPGEHANRVGQRILAYMTETFGPTTRPSVGRERAEYVTGVERILNLFRLNFYTVEAAVLPLDDGLQISVTAPATLWGQQVLAQKGTSLRNDFEAKTVSAYLEACGLRSSYTTAFKGLDVIHTFRIEG
ncbi:unnamed protein product [Chrysoparadoxa australica]